jgi:Xaa-Pro aminopeptidase
MADGGHAPRRGFPVSEFEARTARAQALMARERLDALLLTTEPEVRYFTGFLTQFWQSPTRPWFVVVPASGKPIAVVPAIGAGLMAATWLDDVRSWPSPRPADEGVSLLADTLREAAGENARIGVPRGPETHLRMPLADYRRLLERLPGASTVDATDLIKALRMVKSAAEIEKIAHVCAIVSGVFESLPALLTSLSPSPGRAGPSEIAIFRAFKIACLEGGVDDVAYLVGGAGEGGYASIISPPSARRVRSRDVLVMDAGATFDGYYCDFDRNYAFGPPGDAARRAYDVVFEATEAGFAAARPGACAADVFHAMQRVLDAGGALGNEVGRMGHGLGMQLTEWPSNMPDDRTELRRGMVLTLEPGMTFAPGKLMVHEENIVIGDAGPAYLTRRAPDSLPVIDV